MTLGHTQGVIKKQSMQACFERRSCHWPTLDVPERQLQFFLRGLARVFGKRVRKVFAFRFVAAYEMFDTLKKCSVKVCKNVSGVASTGQACRNLIGSIRMSCKSVIKGCAKRVL